LSRCCRYAKRAAYYHDSHVIGRGGEADTYPGMPYGLGWHIVPEGERLRIQHQGTQPLNCSKRSAP
jgi:hypothetical protein